MELRYNRLKILSKYKEKDLIKFSLNLFEKYGCFCLIYNISKTFTKSNKNFIDFTIYDLSSEYYSELTKEKYYIIINSDGLNICKFTKQLNQDVKSNIVEHIDFDEFITKINEFIKLNKISP